MLIATPSESWGRETSAKLGPNGYQSEVVMNGKDCQVRISKYKYYAVVLDFDISNHSAFEVLKFIKISHPSVKVLLMVKSKDTLDSYSLSPSILRKAGIAEVIIGLPSVEKLKKSLSTLLGLEVWKSVALSNVSAQESAVKAKDSEFMQINIEEFYSGNITVFDHYIRLGPNNYKKILHKGDAFDASRLKKYEADGVKFLYLLLTDRASYINFINQLVSDALKQTTTEVKKSLIIPIKSITVKYMEEIYTSGLNANLVAEGKAICQNMYEYIKKDKSISKTLEELQNCAPDTFNHSFLVSFFSVFICKNLNWAGPRTVDSIALGSLLHDIGMLALPPVLRETKRVDLTPQQEMIYRQHPLRGVELLKKSSFINEPVFQIVYQHHEKIDGSGYPNNITGSKIYPLAKIVSLANAFSALMIEMKLPPKLVLKEFLKSRISLQGFDPLLVKALAEGILSEQ